MSTFELPSVPPFLDGLYLGVNAVPDVWLVIDAPTGCYFKQERIAINHDLRSTLFDPLGRHRIAQTSIDHSSIPFGTEKHVRDLARRVAAETGPEMLLLSEMSMVLMTSNDLRALAGELSAELGLPCRYVRPNIFDGDYLDGQEAFLEAIAAELAAGAGGREIAADTVGIVGYFPDRLEQDHLANVAVLEEQIAALGLRSAGVLLSGRPLAELRAVTEASLLVALPGGEGAARRIAERTGAEVLESGLPLGLAATIDWIRGLAVATAREEAAEAWIDARLAEVVPWIERARSTFLAEAVAAIAAPPDWAEALAAALMELGLHVPLVALRTRHQARVREGAGRIAAAASDGLGPARVIGDFGARTFREALEQVEREQTCDLIIGSGAERAPAHERRIGFIEMGFPSYMHHAFYPRPMLGFPGIARLVEELTNAVLQTRYERHVGAGPRR